MLERIFLKHFRSLGDLRIKDAVTQLQASQLAAALTANTAFEEQLANEIVQVNQSFAQRQQELLERTRRNTG